MKAAAALAQWLGGVKSGQSKLAAAQRKLEAHLANPCNSADASEHRAWLNTRRELEDDVEAEKGALVIAEARAAEAKAAADKESEDAEHRDVGRLNDELKKFTVEICGDAERLAAKLARHKEMLAKVESWNRRHPDRQMIDGERKVREIPSQVIPATTRQEEVWQDREGNRCPVLRLDGDQWVPRDPGPWRRETITITNVRERVQPARMPDRLAKAVLLPGLKGEQLWPPRKS